MTELDYILDSTLFKIFLKSSSHHISYELYAISLADAIEKLQVNPERILSAQVQVGDEWIGLTPNRLRKV